MEDPTLDESLSALLDVAYRKNFRVAIYLESTPDPKDPTVKPEQIIEWLVHGLSSFGSHPAYMKADNYPLVMVFAANAADVEVWRSIFEEVLSLGYEARYFASAADTSYLDVFVGLHGYTPLPASDNKELSVETKYYWSLRESAPGEADQKLFMATVIPGINNCPYGEDPPLVVEREKGRYFRETFASAVQGVPDWMMVTSWNEYGENTHIEPSERYGSKYLNITKQEITAWRNSADVEDARAIARLYSAAFDRIPKVDGLNYWIHVLEGGKTLLQIALMFYESPEFTEKYGPLTDREFVKQLYKNVLGREGLQDGITFWEARLKAGESRAKILERFSESKENITKTQPILENMRLEDGQWVL